MQRDKIYGQAELIIGSFGKTVTLVTGRIAQVYEDAKIHIEAIFKWDQSDVEFVIISLKIPQSQAHPLMLQLASEDENTLVFFFQETRGFFRPGRWEIYLDSLAEKAYKRKTEAQALNGQPIDDTALFPDIDPRSPR